MRSVCTTEATADNNGIYCFHLLANTAFVFPVRIRSKSVCASRRNGWQRKTDKTFGMVSRVPLSSLNAIYYPKVATFGLTLQVWMVLINNWATFIWAGLELYTADMRL